SRAIIGMRIRAPGFITPFSSKASPSSWSSIRFVMSVVPFRGVIVGQAVMLDLFHKPALAGEIAVENRERELCRVLDPAGDAQLGRGEPRVEERQQRAPGLDPMLHAATGIAHHAQ